MYDFARFLVIFQLLISTACTSTTLHAEERTDLPAEVLGEKEKNPPSPQSVKKNKIDLSISAVEKFYSKSETIEMVVNKTLYLKMLDQKKKFTGKLLLKRPGRLRLEFSTPEKSIAVVTPKKFVLIQFPQDDFDTTVRVTRSANTKRIQSQHLVALLLGKGSISKEFKQVKKTTTPGAGILYSLKPRKNDTDILSVEIQIVEGKESGIIKQISYMDRLENLTTLEFEQTTFGQKIDSKQFDLEIPAQAEITEI